MPKSPHEDAPKPLPLDPPWDEIRRWHEAVSAQCDETIDACCDALHKIADSGTDPKEMPARSTLATLLANPTTCRYFGTPGEKPIAVSMGEDNGSVAERYCWGQRVGKHLLAFSDGLLLRKQLKPEKEWLCREELVLSLRDRIVTAYPIAPASIDTVKQVLLSDDRERGFAKCARTRFDDVHWALAYLTRHDEDVKHSKRAKAFLLDLARDTLRKYMSADTDVSSLPVVTDESNLWWALAELLRREKDKFSIGDDSGYEAATSILERLLENGGNQRSHSPAEAVFEIPPEAFGDLRTRLLAMRHAIDIAQEMPEDMVPELAASMTDFIEGQFRFVKSKQQASLYLQGLCLQASSKLVQYGSDKAGPDPPEPSAIWSLGDCWFLVEYPGGKRMERERRTVFGRTIQAIIDLGGEATNPEVRKITGIQNAGRAIKDGFRSDCNQIFKRFVDRAEKKGNGGHKVYIKPWPGEQRTGGRRSLQHLEATSIPIVDSIPPASC